MFIFSSVGRTSKLFIYQWGICFSVISAIIFSTENLSTPAHRSKFCVQWMWKQGLLCVDYVRHCCTAWPNNRIMWLEMQNTGMYKAKGLMNIFIFNGTDSLHYHVRKCYCSSTLIWNCCKLSESPAFIRNYCVNRTSHLRADGRRLREIHFGLSSHCCTIVCFFKPHWPVACIYQLCLTIEKLWHCYCSLTLHLVYYCLF